MDFQSIMDYHDSRNSDIYEYYQDTIGILSGYWASSVDLLNISIYKYHDLYAFHTNLDGQMTSVLSR